MGQSSTAMVCPLKPHTGAPYACNDNGRIVMSPLKFENQNQLVRIACELNVTSRVLLLIGSLENAYRQLKRMPFDVWQWNQSMRSALQHT